MRIFAKSLELVLLCLIILGGAYVYSSWVGGSIADSFNGSAALVRGDE